MTEAYVARQIAMCTRPSSSQSSTARGVMVKPCSVMKLTVERTLESLELAVELPGETGTDVRLEHEPDTW